MILVDPLFNGKGMYHGERAAQANYVGERSGHRWCHMVSDTSDEELHAFAARLGLKRGWFQGDHYDLTASKRALAIRLGAQEVSALELSMVARYDRQGRERPSYGRNTDA